MDKYRESFKTRVNNARKGKLPDQKRLELTDSVTDPTDPDETEE